MSAIAIRNLTKRYPGTQAGLFEFSLDVESGEHLVIAGPSGAGKTTLLRLVAGLETPDAGSIAIGSADVTRLPPRKREVALVAQRPAIYPHLSVRRNLSASVELRQRRWPWRSADSNGVSAAELESRVADAAETLGLTPLLDRRADKLSGGEQQRVALGRAWVARGLRLWLLDEPLAHLDPALRAAIRAELHLLRGRSGATMLEVTHDPGDALALGRRVAVLRAGRLEQVGPAAELYARPASRTVAAALGSSGDQPRRRRRDFGGRPSRHAIAARRDGPASGRRSDREVGSGMSVCLGVRPEHMIPATADGLVPLGDWSVLRTCPLWAGVAGDLGTTRPRVAGLAQR